MYRKPAFLVVFQSLLLGEKGYRAQHHNQAISLRHYAETVTSQNSLWYVLYVLYAPIWSDFKFWYRFHHVRLYWSCLKECPDWRETKRKCTDWIQDQLCDIDLWSHPWHCPCIFQGKNCNSCISESVGMNDETKRKRGSAVNTSILRFRVVLYFIMATTANSTVYGGTINIRYMLGLFSIYHEYTHRRV